MVASARSHVPDATVNRLALYHCFLGELHRAEGVQRLTSARLASELDLKEETVRRDLSFVGSVGRPGQGYQSDALFSALQDYLGLTDEYPIIQVGAAQMLEALGVVFPSEAYGVRPVACFSERPEDAGAVVDGCVVGHIDQIPAFDRELGVSVALVACSPRSVQHVIDLLAQAGVTGVLLLTPAIKIERPDGMEITQVRMPCDLKSIACRCKLSPTSS